MYTARFLFRRIGPLMISALLVLPAWSGPAPAAEAATLELVYSGNLDGELEPCGCTEAGDLGGLRRRASLVDRWRQAAPDLVLVSAGGLFSASSVTDRITNRFILEGMAGMGYDGVGVQWSDLIYGAEFLADVDLPRIASNWRDGRFQRELRVVRGALGLRLFQWLDPQASPYAALPAATRPTHADPTALGQALATAAAAGDLVVLATTLSVERARAELPLDQVDVLIAAAEFERYAEPEQIGPTLVLRPGSRGQRLGRLSLELDSAGRIKSWRHRVEPLPSSVGDWPGLDPWYERFSQALMADYTRRIAATKAADPASRRFVGGGACVACHQAAAESWRNTRHAHAFASLQAVDKAFDANCVGCHSLGFGAEDGFIDLQSTPDLADVQCESCHGPARPHVDSGGLEPPGPASACESCHNHSHSPGFDFSSYWPKLRHGPAPTQP